MQRGYCGGHWNDRRYKRNWGLNFKAFTLPNEIKDYAVAHVGQVYRLIKIGAAEN